MRFDLLKEMYETEGYYWWHKAKRAYVLYLLKKFNKLENVKILDIGCGTGYLLKELNKYTTAYGVDKSKISLSFCRQRGLKNIWQVDIEKRSFTKNKFDVVTALDVIEHIKDDRQALKNIANCLQDDGILIIFTPAFPSLWSYWDEVAGHYRRYHQNSLKSLLQESGFEIKYLRFADSVIFIPAIFIRFIKGRFGNNKLTDLKSDFVKVPPLINELLFLLLRAEMLISSILPFPFGLSFIVVAKKIVK